VTYQSFSLLSRDEQHRVVQLSPAQHAALSTQILRQHFLAEPPAVQAETLRRVRRIVAERPDTELARLAAPVYGL
jgi:hypothetical protein